MRSSVTPATINHGSGPRRDRGDRDGLLEHVCERDVVVCVAVKLRGGTRSGGTRSGERLVVLFEEPLPDVLCLLPGRLVLSVVGRSGASRWCEVAPALECLC